MWFVLDWSSRVCGGQGPPKGTGHQHISQVLSVCVINDERRIMREIYLEDACEVFVSSWASLVWVKKEVVALGCL